jgi:hypothetical protein
VSWVGSARTWRLAAAAILVVLLFGNIRLILGTETPQWDASDFFGPQFSLVADFVKHGQFLRWDPWIAGGTPDFAEPELGTTSPLLLLIGLVSPNPQAGFIAYWLVLWAIGGVGMLWLTRYLGSPAWGGLIVALGYVTSGFYTANAEHTSSICSIAFLPWILWKFDHAIQTHNYWASIQGGVLYGLSALGGYPEFTILTPGFLLVWGIGRVLFGGGPTERLRRFGRMLLLAGLLVSVGSLICCPPYAGFLKDTHGYSDRVGPRDRNQSVGSNILPAGALTTFASPFLYLLNQSPNPIWPVSDISMSNVYMGAAAFAFAILALRRNQAWRFWLLSIALFFGCCALGNQLPLRGWLYDYVPPTRYFRNAAYFREYFILALAVLAAYAARDLGSRDEIDRASKRFFPISIALAAGCIAAFFVVSRRKSAMLPEFHFAVAHLLIVWFGLAILAYWLWKRPSRRALAFRFLALLAFADAWGTLSIDRSTISTRATEPWWAVMNSQHVQTLDLSTPGIQRVAIPPAVLGASENNRNLPLKIATFNNFIVFANRFHRLFVSDPLLEKMALGADRFWFSANPSWTPPTGAAFQILRDRMHEVSAPPLLLHLAADMPRLSAQDVDPPESVRGPTPPEPCLQARISQLSYHPASLAFHYIAPSAGWLMITDRWAPGWQAAVNGSPREVLGADFIFRAVQVGAGDNQVTLEYKPQGQFVCLAISWGTLLAFVACEIRRRWRRHGSDHESALEQAIAEERIGLLHLQTNGAEGNVPHPLFDEAYYLRNNPQVAASGLPPLLHYRQIGAKELRNPHALFDAKFYVAQHPEVLAANADPLLHFLTQGAKLRYNPNPYFDIEFYLWRNPEVEASGMNPLVHFVKLGAAKGLDPSPLFGMKDYLARYPDLVAVGAEPLSHYLEFGRLDNRTFARPLCFAERLSSDYTPAEVSPPSVDGRMLRPELPLPIFCVYGPSNVEFIRDAVIPAFQNESASVPVALHFVNYKAREALLTGIANVKDWSSQRSSGHWGFGESVNYLFEAVRPERCFLLCNPDSFPMQGCLARLVETYVARDAAIVEARQWPSAHPKEFDPETLETPWASGAFALISSAAFRALDGFDPLYFLYTEDVDLSWRAWLKGLRVIHQPLALCAHATGLHSYGSTRFYYEHFFSLRNFLIISYKFFAELGERIAMEYLRAAALPEELYKKVLDDYRRLKPSIAVQPPIAGNASQVKILGLNVFHELRQ